MFNIEILVYVGIMIVAHSAFLAVKQLYDNKLNYTYYGNFLILSMVLIGTGLIVPVFELLKTGIIEQIISYSVFVIGLLIYFVLLLSYYRESSKKILIAFMNAIIVTLCTVMISVIPEQYNFVTFIFFGLVQFFDMIIWTKKYNNHVEMKENI